MVPIAEEEAEKEFLTEMVRRAAIGELELESYQPDISVAVQQIFSCLFQHRQGMPEEELVDLLSPLVSEEECLSILGELLEEEYLDKRGGAWVGTEKLMDQAEHGNIHSNIPDAGTMRVVEADTGREIGKISRKFDKTFVLG